MFPADARVDSIFYKLLTTNDDSGRHGVLIPTDAYDFFPAIPGFDPDAGQNYLVPITTTWRDGEQWVERESNFAHYHRYPERRITSLHPSTVNVDEPIRLLVLGRTGTRSYCAAVITPRDAGFEAIATELGIPAASRVPGGAQGIVRPADLRVGGARTVFDRLLDLLVGVAGQGYVPSMRAGDTGVGYTLETLLQIQANVRMDADFHGIELKATRSREPVERRRPPRESVTLFAKTPEWDPVGSRQNLLDRHGYYDANGRWGLYMSIFAGHPNPPGMVTVSPRRGRAVNGRSARRPAGLLAIFRARQAPPGETRRDGVRDRPRRGARREGALPLRRDPALRGCETCPTCWALSMSAASSTTSRCTAVRTAPRATTGSCFEPRRTTCPGSSLPLKVAAWSRRVPAQPALPGRRGPAEHQVAGASASPDSSAQRGESLGRPGPCLNGHDASRSESSP